MDEYDAARAGPQLDRAQGLRYPGPERACLRRGAGRATTLGRCRVVDGDGAALAGRPVGVRAAGWSAEQATTVTISSSAAKNQPTLWGRRTGQIEAGEPACAAMRVSIWITEEGCGTMVGDAILVEGLRKRYGDVVALDGVDLAVPQGTVLGLLGPNGAGKTTAVRVLTTLTRPDAGRAEVAGLDVVREPARVRTMIGLAGQYAAVDENLTGRENLVLVGRLNHMARPDCRSRAANLLGRFELTDAADRTVKTYSGGMRRRLDLALALVNRPPVLFLDEPTTGLDPRSRTELWSIIGELVTEGTTLLLTTQYLEEADRLADRIAVIDVGRVIAEGTSEELKARLGGTSLEVGVADDAAAKDAAQVLAPLGTLAERDGSGTLLRLRVEDGPRALVEVVRGLDARGIAATTLALREPSLDDVFLALTGHAAEAAEPLEGDGPAGKRGRRGRRHVRSSA